MIYTINHWHHTKGYSRTIIVAKSSSEAAQAFIDRETGAIILTVEHMNQKRAL